MAGKLSVVEVGSCTVSQDQLKMQSTMWVFEICPLGPTSLSDVYPDQDGISCQVRSAVISLPSHQRDLRIYKY